MASSTDLRSSRPGSKGGSDQQSSDPWSDLDDFTPTDTLIQGQETRADSSRPRPSPRPRRSPESPGHGPNPWVFVIPILATLVIVACVLTIATVVRGKG